MKATWSADLIASLLRDAFAPSSSNAKQQTQSPTATIDILITFDQNGISSHPNHISLYHGARAFVASLTTTSSIPSPIDIYTLTTVNVLRKYVGIFDAFTTLVSGTLAQWRQSGGRSSTTTTAKTTITSTSTTARKEHPPALVIMHGLGKGGWLTAREAMTRAHLSQMVWFRYGWITLSRYMFMNDLRLESV